MLKISEKIKDIFGIKIVLMEFCSCRFFGRVLKRWFCVENQYWNRIFGSFLIYNITITDNREFRINLIYVLCFIQTIKLTKNNYMAINKRYRK